MSMSTSRRRLLFAAGLAVTLPAHAIDWGGILKGALGTPAGDAPAAPGGVDALSAADIDAGLKEALTRGTDGAVVQLGRRDGFFADPRLRIPLPPALQKAERAMRMLGMGGQADGLVLAMNRAAEAAVPEAKSLLIGAVREMTLEDARGILTGGETAATDFLRRKTEATLTERFTPLVKRHTDEIGLARQYNQYAAMAAQFALLDPRHARVEEYVAQQALGGLYTVIGEKEAAIRANPLQAGSALLRTVFGALSGR
ncbi:MAG TPA: DUF4197 domain-containing protein [Thiobacillaceae bacterium]|nr:DUF4197 domain-containing protein [Thiobacillaceae bacterium]